MKDWESARELLTDAERDALAELGFDLDEKYQLGFTNSPDMHPDAPEIADMVADIWIAVAPLLVARELGS